MAEPPSDAHLTCAKAVGAARGPDNCFLLHSAQSFFHAAPPSDREITVRFTCCSPLPSIPSRKTVSARTTRPPTDRARALHASITGCVPFHGFYDVFFATGVVRSQATPRWYSANVFVENVGAELRRVACAGREPCLPWNGLINRGTRRSIVSFAVRTKSITVVRFQI